MAARPRSDAAAPTTSATLLGAALDATEVQIWTDVPGVLSADPRQASRGPRRAGDQLRGGPGARPFRRQGPSPRTIRPAVARDIPVRILDIRPARAGHDRPAPRLEKRDQGGHGDEGADDASIDVPELEDLAGAAAAVFAQLHVDRVEIVHVAQASSRRRMTYLVDGGSAGGCSATVSTLDSALDDFEASISCNDEVALVAAVGQGAADQPATLGKMMEALRRAGVPVLGSSQQSTNVALVAVVPARTRRRRSRPCTKHRPPAGWRRDGDARAALADCQIRCGLGSEVGA